MGERVVTVNDVLDGHTVLDLSCLDRLYLSGFVQRLQTRRGRVLPAPAPRHADRVAGGVRPDRQPVP